MKNNGGKQEGKELTSPSSTPFRNIFLRFHFLSRIILGEEFLAGQLATFKGFPVLFCNLSNWYSMATYNSVHVIPTLISPDLDPIITATIGFW